MSESLALAQTDEGTNYVPMDRLELIEAIKYDLNTFSASVLPMEHVEDFPEVHCNIWAECLQSVNGIERLCKFAIGLPRGHAKTQLMKFLILYCILFTNRNFILIVCNAATLAQNLLNDVMNMLASDNVVALFGDYRDGIIKDTQDLKQFKFLKKDIILKPIGASSAVRGTNINNRRPELILCDDMQSAAEAKSPDVSTILLQWFLGTLLKARSYKRCTVIYVGNMYPDLEIGQRGSGVYSCILRNLQLNSAWRTWIVGAILGDGTALWEAVIPLETLLSELQQDLELQQEEIFYAEVLNDPKATNTRFIQLDKIQYAEYTKYDLPIGKFLIIDPSLGKKKSDDQMVGYFHVYDERGPVLQEMRNFQCSAPDLVQGIIQWALEENIPFVVAESVAYQASLVQWFLHFFNVLGIEGITCAGVLPKGVSKVTRILHFFKSWMNGAVRTTKESAALIKDQATAYVPTSATNVDDALDVMAYAEQVFIEFETEWTVDIEALVDSRVESSEALPEHPKGLTEFLS